MKVAGSKLRFADFEEIKGNTMHIDNIIGLLITIQSFRAGIFHFYKNCADILEPNSSNICIISAMSHFVRASTRHGTSPVKIERTGKDMGWSFRKRIKIAPGVRINLSKSGISTSIGGKGFTYNTRGRITTSVPGTGIRFTHNLNAKRTARPIRSAVAASEHIDSTRHQQLSKRERATVDFVQQLQSRTSTALRRYFISHGVYVEEGNLVEAVTLDEYQPFLETLSKELEITTNAVKLSIDIGTISLAEKEKAMRALYEIERKCSSNQGGKGGLEHIAHELAETATTWPKAPNFGTSIVVALVGCVFLIANSIAVGLALLAGACAYGRYTLNVFQKQKSAVTTNYEQSNAKFDSLVSVEISPRPGIPDSQDNVHSKAVALATAIAGLAAIALVAGMRDTGGQSANQSATSGTATTPAIAAIPNIQTAPLTTLAASTPPEKTSVANFDWLVGKYPYDIVNDPRFHEAFRHIASGDWRKIRERLAVTDANGIQFKDGYFFGAGCKAHACDSDAAAFAIDEKTGKGDIVSIESTEDGLRKSMVNRFAWDDMPIATTPLAVWLAANTPITLPTPLETSSNPPSATAPASTASVSATQPSFDCEKARSDAEHLICSDPELAADDIELAGLYARAKNAVSNQTAFSQRTRAEWSYREKTCHDRDCLIRWYADQRGVLKRIVESGDANAD